MMYRHRTLNQVRSNYIFVPIIEKVPKKEWRATCVLAGLKCTGRFKHKVQLAYIETTYFSNDHSRVKKRRKADWDFKSMLKISRGY